MKTKYSDITTMFEVPWLRGAPWLEMSLGPLISCWGKEGPTSGRAQGDRMWLGQLTA